MRASTTDAIACAVWDTINYEVTCVIGRRVPRIAVESDGEEIEFLDDIRE